MGRISGSDTSSSPVGMRGSAVFGLRFRQPDGFCKILPIVNKLRFSLPPCTEQTGATKDFTGTRPKNRVNFQGRPLGDLSNRVRSRQLAPQGLGATIVPGMDMARHLMRSPLFFGTTYLERTSRTRARSRPRQQIIISQHAQRVGYNVQLGFISNNTGTDSDTVRPLDISLPLHAFPAEEIQSGLV